LARQKHELLAGTVTAIEQLVDRGSAKTLHSRSCAAQTSHPLAIDDTKLAAPPRQSWTTTVKRPLQRAAVRLAALSCQ
jgi:hypothetical protein